MDIIEISLILILIKLLLTIIFIYSLTFKVIHEIDLKNNQIRASDNWVKNNIGRITSIVGRVKTGKSSFLCAVMHSATRIIKDDLSARIESIKSDLYFLDFNEVDEFLINQYLLTSDTELVGENLYNEFHLKNYLLHDFVNVKISKKLLMDYAKYFYHLNIKNCYMFTKGISLYDRENNSPSKYIFDETLEIKKVKDTHIYYNQIASVIGEDEKSVRDSNTKSNDKESKESGTKEFKIFYGHITRELGYYFTTKQIEVDEIVTTRRLNMTTYETKRAVEKIYNFPTIQKACDFLVKIRYFFFRIPYLFVIGKERKARKMNFKYNSCRCRFRKFVSKIDQIKNWCDSQGLLVHEGNLYVYSPVSCKLELINDDVCLPLPYRESRGVYNCYEFECVQDELEKLSNVRSDEIPFTERFGKGLDNEKVSFLYESGKKNIENDF